jgi:ionotropic glutamate receptor
MKKIERAWLGEQTNCQNSNSWVSYGSLSLKSFWGLFLIAGIGSLLALSISISTFLHKERGKSLSSLIQKAQYGVEFVIS